MEQVNIKGVNDISNKTYADTQIEYLLSIKEEIEKRGFGHVSEANAFISIIVEHLLNGEKLNVQLNHAWLNCGEYIDVNRLYQ